MNCKYCLGDSSVFLIDSPCYCKNQVHLKCLMRWFFTSKTTHCPECGYDNLNRYWVAGIFLVTKVCFLFLELCSTIHNTLHQTPNGS